MRVDRTDTIIRFANMNDGLKVLTSTTSATREIGEQPKRYVYSKARNKTELKVGEVYYFQVEWQSSQEDDKPMEYRGKSGNMHIFKAVNGGYIVSLNEFDVYERLWEIDEKADAKLGGSRYVNYFMNRNIPNYKDTYAYEAVNGKRVYINGVLQD